MSVRTDTVNLIVNVNGDKSKKELNDLRKASADLKHEMQQLAADGKKNTQEYKDKSAAVKELEGKMSELRKQMGLTAMNQKELVNELRRLHALKSVTTPQTKEFFELQKQIEKVNNRLYEVKNGVFGFGAALHKVKDEIKAFGVLALGYLGFEFITQQFKSMIMGSGALEDKLADVQRVTGMTKDEVKDLQQQLKEIDTRTAQQQLLDYAVTAGKLGVATNEIKEFVKSTDMLVTALGDELGDAANITDNLGKIINVYDGAGKITGERTLQIGNAIVELANAGVASGGFIVDFTKRLGGLAGTANIALNASIGMAAGLEELGQSAETSSTAISTVLVKIGSDVPNFARLAGKDVKDFAHTLRTAPMEALIQLSQGITKGKLFSQIATEFKEAEAAGGRVVSTLGAIGNNADFLRGKILTAGEALQDTAGITDAFALKNNTLGASIDKLGKEFNRMATSGAVVQFLKGAIENTLTFIQSLAQLPDWLERNRTMLIVLAGAVAFYTRAKIAKMIVDAKEYVQLSLMYAQDKAMLILRGLQTVATRAYSTVVQLMTGQITLATVASRIFNGVAMTMTGIVGIVIAAITTAAALWSAFGSKVKESASSLKIWGGMMAEAAQNAGKELGQLQQLYATVTNGKLSIDQRTEAYKKMQALYPDILKNMTFEDAIAGKLKESYKLLTDAIMGKSLMQASDNSFTKLGQDLFAVEQQIQSYSNTLKTLQQQNAGLGGPSGSSPQEQFLKKQIKMLEDQKNGILKSFDQMTAFQGKLKKDYGIKDAAAPDISNSVTNTQDDKALAKLKKAQEAKEKALAEHLKRIKEKIEDIRFELEQNEKDGDEQERARILRKYAELLKEAAGFHKQTIELEELKQRELEQFAARASKKWLRLNQDFNAENLAASKEAIDNIRKHAEKSLEIVDRLRKKLISDMEDSYNKQVKKQKDKEDALIKGAMEGLSRMSSIYSQINDLQNQKDQMALDAELSRNEQRKVSFDNMLRRKAISQAQYDREISKIEAQSDKRKAEYEEKAARRKKRAAYMQAIVNAALGITQIWGTYAAVPYVAAALTALEVIATGVQIAAISGADVPTGRDGLIVPGESHENGGVDLVDNKTGRRMANVEGGEPLLVLSKNTYKNNKQVIDDLFYASKHQNGKSIIPKWYSNSSAINMSTVLPALAKGGMMQMQNEFSNGFSAMKTDMSATNSLLLKISTQLSESSTAPTSGSMKAYVVLKDITSAQQLMEQARREGSLKQ